MTHRGHSNGTGQGKRNGPDSSQERAAVTPSRRALLTALGAAAMPTVAGCSGSSNQTPADTQAETDTDSKTPMQQMTDTPQTDSPEVDPRFGYVGSGSEEPPVTPDHTVNMVIRPREDAWLPEFYFDPVGLAVEPGDTVQFNMASPHHNVNAYHPAFGYTQRIPEGTPPYSSPVMVPGDYWLKTFETEGVHNIMCAPHELFGMVGSVVVGSPTGPGSNPVGEAPKPTEQSRPPEFTAGLVLSDPALDPENVASAGTVSWSELRPESKEPLLVPLGEE